MFIKGHISTKFPPTTMLLNTLIGKKNMFLSVKKNLIVEGVFVNISIPPV